MKRTFFLPLFIVTLTCVFSACGDDEDEDEPKYTCIDGSGKSYKTVVIGDQVWMAENLATMRENSGVAIDNSQYVVGSPGQAFPQFSYLYNNSSYFNKYGLLYNHFAAKRVQIIPVGWRIPTRADWDKLFTYVRAHPAYGSDNDFWVGKALASSTDWKGNSTSGTIGFQQNTNNKFGFNAFPGGYKSIYGTFAYENERCYFWTSTPDVTTPTYLQLVELRYDTPTVAFVTLDSMKCGAYIRCVRDI